MYRIPYLVHWDRDKSGDRYWRDAIGIGIAGLVEFLVLSWIKVFHAFAMANMVGDSA